MSIKEINQIICGDAQQQLKILPDDCIDLIFTSPPYANQRRKQYPGVAAIHYVDWFTPIAEQLYRVLKPTGTFILNIKENVIRGEKSPYVLELILALRHRVGFGQKNLSGIRKTVFPVNGRIVLETDGSGYCNSTNRENSPCIRKQS
jgi:site-specific DNA-methyltransferase (adenine-specific)